MYESLFICKLVQSCFFPVLKIEQSISYILYCLVTLCSSVFGKDRRGQSRPKKRQSNIYTQSLSAPSPSSETVQHSGISHHFKHSPPHFYFSSSKIQQVQDQYFT